MSMLPGPNFYPDKSPRPGWQAAGALYLFFAAVVLRTLAHEGIRPRLPIYLALELLYLAVLSAMLWRPARRPAACHLYFGLQTLIVFGLQTLRLRFDFIIVLYIPLAFQAGLLLRGPLLDRELPIEGVEGLEALRFLSLRHPQVNGREAAGALFRGMPLAAYLSLAGRGEKAEG